MLFLSFAAGFATVVWRKGRPPGISREHLEEITSLFQREDYAGALKRLQVATKIAPGDESAIYLMGVALQRCSDLAGAKEAYHRVLKIKPSHAGAHFNLGMLYLEQQNPEAAALHNRVVVHLQPANEYARNNLAVALLRQGKTAEATEQLHAALRIHPGFSPAQMTLDSIAGRIPLDKP